MSEATQWHRRPNPNAVCSICGAPVRSSKRPGNSLFAEHRAIRPDEGIDATWLARKKSPLGWQLIEEKRRERKRPAPKLKPKESKAQKAKLPPPLRNVGEARKNSLVRFYYHAFEPERRDKSAYTHRQYERALFKLCEFAQRDVTIGECNDLFFDRFVEWAICEGLAYKTVRSYRAYLRKIVRKARPGVCEKQAGKRPHEAVPTGNNDTELDVEGSLWRFFRDVYRHTKLLGRSEFTANQYIYALRRLYRQFGRRILVTELSDNLVSEHLQWMLDQGCVATTANSARGHVLALWRLAHKKGLLDRLPDVDKLPEPKRQPKAWSVEQLGQILDSCRQQQGKIGQIAAAAWWRAFVLTLYDTGLRRRAASLIRCEHIDLPGGWMFIRAETQKQNAEQQFQLSVDTLDAIHEIWFPERQLLFEWPRDQRQIWADYGKILDRAGLPSGPKDKFHKLRRTTATHIAAVAGVAAASHQLGHSSETMTKGYIDPRFTAKHNGANLLPRPQERSNDTNQPNKPNSNGGIL